MLFEFSYFCYESARASGTNRCEGSCKCEKNYVDLISRTLQNYVNDAIFECGKSHNKKWPHWMDILDIKTCGHGMYSNQLHCNDDHGPPRVIGPQEC